MLVPVQIPFSIFSWIFVSVATTGVIFFNGLITVKGSSHLPVQSSEFSLDKLANVYLVFVVLKLGSRSA